MTTQDGGAGAARYARSRDGASTEVDRLVAFVQARAATAGERQAMEELGALASGLRTEELAGLLAAAVWMLAGPGGPARPGP